MMRVYLMLAAAVVSVGFVFAFQSKEAPAAPIVGSGSFDLDPQQQEVVFNSQNESDVGVTINVSTGSVQVLGTDSQGTTVLGTLGAGSVAVFEGEYLQVQVVAQSVEATGTYENRAPSDDTSNTNPDVGIVDTATAVSGTTQIYFGDTGRARGLSVVVQSGSILVRTSATGSDVAEGDAGETIWTYEMNCSAWYIVGSGTILFDVHQVDNNSPKTTTSTKKSSGSDSTDTVTFTGGTCITGKITNTGKDSIHIRVTYHGGTEDPPESGGESQTHELEKGEEHPFVCKVTEIFIQYDDSQGEAKIEHTPVPGG